MFIHQLSSAGLKAKSGWVAGINHGSHDAACALTHEGNLVVWVEQERLSRNKHAIDESPAESLEACLNFAGIGLNDLDAVALGSDHQGLINWLGDDPNRCAEVNSYSSANHLFPSQLFGDCHKPKVISIPHHLSHAASAFYPSGFESAVAIVMDAMGEQESTTIANCGNCGIHVSKTYDVDHSLGYFYETATSFAGFNHQEAGKLMGLAAYGRPIYDLPLAPPSAEDDRIWRISGSETGFGRSRVVGRCSRLSTFFENVVFPFEGSIKGEPMAYRDFAASVQDVLERIVLSLAETAASEAGCRNIVLSGGVALNCSANGKLANSGIAERLFIQPASTDMGVALGAALQLSNDLYGDSFHHMTMQHAYWGLSETSDEIFKEVELSGMPYRKLDEKSLVNEVAKAISAGEIVAWHQGRAEVGPRALGARSLLGDPRTRKTVVAMNKCKEREVWRPLAPSVPIDSFDSFFDGVPNPFMIVSSNVRADVVKLIPAVTHIDGSARPQVVSKEDNELYYSLLKRFEEIAGVPVLVNSSLNTRGEPICYRARDSLSLLKRGAVNLLAVGEFLVGSFG